MVVVGAARGQEPVGEETTRGPRVRESQCWPVPGTTTDVWEERAAPLPLARTAPCPHNTRRLCNLGMDGMQPSPIFRPG